MIKRRLIARLVRHFALGILLGSYGLVAPAAEKLWQTLKFEGDALELMGMTPAANAFYLYGSAHVSVAVQDAVSGVAPILPPIERRQLYILKADNAEDVLWQHYYADLPEAYEIFSAATTTNGQLCLLYGERIQQPLSYNPLLVQFDAQGTRLWAKRLLGAEHADAKTGHVEQVANLDAIKVLGAADNGCIAIYVANVVSTQQDEYRLRVQAFSNAGAIQWQHNLPTQLYGDLFAVLNQDSGHYTIVKTNLSRDAALLAMLSKEPFVPAVEFISFNTSGKILHEVAGVRGLASVWVNDVTEGRSGTLILAGKKSAAWLQQMDPLSGRVLNSYENSGGAFDTAIIGSGEDLLAARGSRIEVFDRRLQPKTGYDIDSVRREAHINEFLERNLPADLHVEKMLALGSNRYLLLYDFGSRLVEIRLPQPN